MRKKANFKIDEIDKTFNDLFENEKDTMMDHFMDMLNDLNMTDYQLDRLLKEIAEDYRSIAANEKMREKLYSKLGYARYFNEEDERGYTLEPVET
jgi:uncharacterized protein YfbU (UPF0304 family)